MLNSIDQMVERGGLSTKQIRDLAGAAREAYGTRRAEDIEPEPAPLGALSGKSATSKQELLADLVGIDARGVPKFVDFHFAVLDYGSALEAKPGADQEAVDEAWSRLVSMARSYGITKLTESDYAWMQAKIDADFEEEMRRKGKTLQSEGSLEVHLEGQADGS
jgi:hypothetical protein